MKQIIKNDIDKKLKELTALREEVVNNIIDYFKQNIFVFKQPCIIENPVDTLEGGITITQIRKGQAIEATDEYEVNAYDVSTFDDNTLLRLYDWEQVGQHQFD